MIKIDGDQKRLYTAEIDMFYNYTVLLNGH